MTPDPEDRIGNTENELDFEPVKVPKPAKKKSKGTGIGLIVATLVVLVIVGGGGWFLYGTQIKGNGSKSVPIIRADITPVKIKPADPGGLDVPDRDKLVYNRLKGESAGTTVERLLPPPEELLAKPEEITPESAPPGQSAQSVTETTEQGQEPVSLEPVGLQPETQTLESEVAATSEPVEAPAPPPEPVAEPAPEPETVAEPAPVPEPTAEPTIIVSIPTTAVSDVTAFQIQLAALRSEERAIQEWKRLQKKHIDILGSLNENIVRADLGEDKGIFYRLRAGPLSSKADAKSLCQKLAKLNQGCLVIRPGN